MKDLKLNLFKMVICTLATFCRLSNAYAAEGGMHGGGGNSVVCFAGREDIAKKVKERGFVVDNELQYISNIVTFDLWEAQEEIIRDDGTAFKPEIIPIGDNETWQDYVKKIAKRFEFAVPDISKILLKGLEAFSSENTTFKKLPLKNIDDTNRPTELASAECSLVTVARQEWIGNVRTLQFDHRLTHNKHHSNLSFAILRLHEILYAYARDNKQVDSKNTRLFVANLITKNNNISAVKMVDVGLNLKFLLAGARSKDVQSYARFAEPLVQISTFQSEMVDFAFEFIEGNATIKGQLNNLFKKTKEILFRTHLSTNEFNAGDFSISDLNFNINVLSNAESLRYRGLSLELDQDRIALLKECQKIGYELAILLKTNMEQHYTSGIRPKLFALPRWKASVLKEYDKAFFQAIHSVPKMVYDEKKKLWTIPEISQQNFIIPLIDFQVD